MSPRIQAAQRKALEQIQTEARRQQGCRNEVIACGVIVASAMPDWSVAEILAVHFRMHKAEGSLFRDALVSATIACGLKLTAIPEKQLLSCVESTFGTGPGRRILNHATTLGKEVGPPWGKEHKDCALAAILALADAPSPLNK